MAKKHETQRIERIIEAFAEAHAKDIKEQTAKILNVDLDLKRFDPDNELNQMFPKKNGKRQPTKAELAVIAIRWNIDPMGIYCQKTGKRIGTRDKENIAKLIDRFGLKKATEIAAYMPLTCGVDINWVYTQMKGKNNLKWLQEHDTPAYFVFIADRCLRHLQPGWQRSPRNRIELFSNDDMLMREIHWQNSKIKAYQLAKEYDKKNHVNLVAVTNRLDLVGEISPRSINWNVQYPHEMCNDAYFKYILEHMTQTIYEKKLKFDNAKSGNTENLTRFLKGHLDIKISGRLTNESVGEHIDRMATIFVPHKFVPKEINVEVPDEKNTYTGILQNYSEVKTKAKFKFNIKKQED